MTAKFEAANQLLTVLSQSTATRLIALPKHSPETK
jgi:hypothetical protein